MPRCVAPLGATRVPSPLGTPFAPLTAVRAPVAGDKVARPVARAVVPLAAVLGPVGVRLGPRPVLAPAAELALVPITRGVHQQPSPVERVLLPRTIVGAAVDRRLAAPFPSPFPPRAAVAESAVARREVALAVALAADPVPVVEVARQGLLEDAAAVPQAARKAAVVDVSVREPHTRNAAPRLPRDLVGPRWRRREGARRTFALVEGATDPPCGRRG